MSKHCAIMQRMKNNYENRSKTFLTRRTPVICRIDGKAFHTYTRGLNKPFDEGLMEDMTDTAIYLCQNIQGVKCAYVQSDEISILITDYDTLQTDAWFDYNVQKMTSISASLATGIFNQLRFQRILDNQSEYYFSRNGSIELSDTPLANFDSRVFNIPVDEVANYFLARQKDAVKNSIAMLAQSLYSHKELDGVNSNQMQELCFQKGHNWNDLHWNKKRGTLIIKNTYADDKLVNKFGENTVYDEPAALDEKDVWFDGEEYWEVDSSLDTDDTKMFSWVDFEPEKIRTKWEAVETPMAFSNKNFEHLC